MPDAFTWDLVSAPYTRMVKEIDKGVNKSTMYALREMGRGAARAFKVEPSVPRYKGPRNRSKYVDPRAVAESGQLSRGLRNAKRLIDLGGGDYSMHVAPYGTKGSGSAVSRYGGGGSVAEIAAGRLNMKTTGKKGTSYFVSRQGTRRHAAVVGNSTAGQIRGSILYAGKLDAMYHYMPSIGVWAATGAAKTIFENAYNKQFAKVSR